MMKSRFSALFHIRLFDFIVFFIFMGIVVLSFITLKSPRSGTPVLNVQTPHGKYIYPLDHDADLLFGGLIGITKLQISDGAAFIVSSPCANKNCIGMGHLDDKGEWAACLPNGIIIYIE